MYLLWYHKFPYIAISHISRVQKKLVLISDIFLTVLVADIQIFVSYLHTAYMYLHSQYMYDYITLLT